MSENTSQSSFFLELFNDLKKVGLKYFCFTGKLKKPKTGRWSVISLTTMPALTESYESYYDDERVSESNCQKLPEANFC